MRHKHPDFPAPIRGHAQVAATSTRAEALPSAATHWIQSPAWDLVWILNALWLAPLVLLLAPKSMLPMPLDERVVWLAVLNYLCVSYHFAAPHFGLLSLYRARVGRASDATARRLDRCFALVVGGGFVMLAEALAGSIAFQERWIDPLLGATGAEAFARTLHDGGASPSS